VLTSLARGFYSFAGFRFLLGAGESANWPAATKAGAAILLTNGPAPAPPTTTYLSAHNSDILFALGGPAFAAYPAATPIVGADRYETSVKVAEQFFSASTMVGIASGEVFPDALTGGPHIGAKGGPLLLVQLGGVPGSVAAYLSSNAASISAAFAYGGTAVIADSTLSDAQLTISGH